MTLCAALPEEDPSTSNRPPLPDSALADLACGLLKVYSARDRYHSVVARRHKVSISALNCLCYCRFDGPQTSSQLADLLGVTPSAITAMVESLVRRGLATRSHDPNDRRVIMVRVTEAGSAVVDRLAGPLGRRLGTAGDPAIVIDLLTRLSAALDACAQEARATSE